MIFLCRHKKTANKNIIHVPDARDSKQVFAVKNIVSKMRTENRVETLLYSSLKSSA
jgi:hypothetical protein